MIVLNYKRRVTLDWTYNGLHYVCEITKEHKDFMAFVHLKDVVYGPECECMVLYYKGNLHGVIASGHISDLGRVESFEPPRHRGVLTRKIFDQLSKEEINAITHTMGLCRTIEEGYLLAKGISPQLFPEDLARF